MISIHPKIVYRVPCFSIDANIFDCWADLKNAIAESSPEFYSLIAKIEKESLDSLPPKIFDTIWKYFNRSRFRATPYGSFAGVGLTESEDKGLDGIIISKQQQLHEFLDWAGSDLIDYKRMKGFDIPIVLQANKSYYLIGDVIRFISKTEGGFVLSEIEYDQSILDLLRRCQNKISVAEFSQEPNSLALIEHLVENQLLLTSLMPNIIGDDYFERIGANHLANNGKKYIIAERPCLGGSVDSTLLKHLPGLVNLLNKLSPPAPNLQLKDFINRFTQKFEQAEVPIMVALDPELGVGYDDLETSANEDPFLDELITGAIKPSGNRRTFSDAYIKELLNHTTTEAFIELERLIDYKVEEPEPISNTISVLCYACDEKIVIESIGGFTANALLGRFTHTNNQFHSLCKELASIEQQANPDVLFFDIAYQLEGTVDNVNRRKSIYSHQLSIVDYDTSDYPLALNDLQLSVKQGVLFLRSATLNKRLIPKMASAYNSTRSDLSVFRLLHDMQYQQIHASLNLALSNLIADLDFYPGVTYKNIVLSTRKWKIRYGNDPKIMLDKFRQILESGCRFVRYGRADKTLCFDLSNMTDNRMLSNLIKKQKSAYVEEVMMGDKTKVFDTEGKGYMAQFMITLYHKKTIYNSFRNLPDYDKSSIVKTFPPGSQWLYFQIFLHPFRADEVLTQELSDILSESADVLESFFFIRYYEDGHHIRLRIKLNAIFQMAEFLETFYKRLHLKSEQGLISSIRICTYKREGERYGWDNICAVENFFFVDSKNTLKVISAGPSINQKYHITLNIIEAIRLSAIFEPEEFYSILDKVCNAFQKEHNFGPIEFKKLNGYYKENINYQFDFRLSGLTDQLTFLISELVLVLEKCPDKIKRQQLFIDLIHMHVNRLHNSKQRYHEALIYYFALKGLLKGEAMKNKPFNKGNAMPND